MQYWHRNQEDDEQAYVMFQMNKHEWTELRAHFHADEGEDVDPMIVKMPYGARLVKQDLGYYKLINYRTNNGARKIHTALQFILRFFRDLQKREFEEIRHLAHIDLQVRNGQKKQATDNGPKSDQIPSVVRDGVVASKQWTGVNKQPVFRPANPNQLKALAQKFGRPQR